MVRTQPNSSTEPPAENIPDLDTSWDNVHDDCMLCEMERKTEWYFENDKLVVAEKLGGGTFVVWKEHKKQLESSEQGYIEGVLDVLLDQDYKLRIMMNVVDDHFHVHVLPENDDIDLSGE